jgi:hypothetical protein
MNDVSTGLHLETVVLAKMEGNRPVYPGVESLSSQMRIEKALTYYNNQIYLEGNNAIHFEDIPAWLRQVAKIRSALIVVKSFFITPGRDIL